MRMASQLLTMPSSAPTSGRSHHRSKRRYTAASTTPMANPQTAPKRITQRSSAAATSRTRRARRSAFSPESSDTMSPRGSSDVAKWGLICSTALTRASWDSAATATAARSRSVESSPSQAPGCRDSATDRARSDAAASSAGATMAASSAGSMPSRNSCTSSAEPVTVSAMPAANLGDRRWTTPCQPMGPMPT